MNSTHWLHIEYIAKSIMYLFVQNGTSNDLSIKKRLGKQTFKINIRTLTCPLRKHLRCFLRGSFYWSREKLHTHPPIPQCFGQKACFRGWGVCVCIYIYIVKGPAAGVYKASHSSLVGRPFVFLSAGCVKLGVARG